MAFVAEVCKFNGVSCETYDLILARDGGEESNSSFASGPEIADSYLPRKWRSHFYGVTRPNKLTFPITLVLNNCRLDAGNYLTREEIEAIAKWLTSPNTYSWLEMIQPDMYNSDLLHPAPIYRYRCMITGLELLFINEQPYGVTATATCDSPYAYLPSYSQNVAVTVAGSPKTVTVVNNSTIEKGVRPTFILIYDDEYEDTYGPISIKNDTTNEELAISTIPSTVSQIRIDCERGIITADDGSNLYQYCNFVFPHFARGSNTLKIANNNGFSIIDVSISCDFPVDIGA